MTAFAPPHNPPSTAGLLSAARGSPLERGWRKLTPHPWWPPAPSLPRPRRPAFVPHWGGGRAFPAAARRAGGGVGRGGGGRALRLAGVGAGGAGPGGAAARDGGGAGPGRRAYTDGV